MITTKPIAAATTPRAVLIAERDQRVREFQEFYLTRAGYAVAFVDDGEAALESARATQPALVIADILLPKIDGLALCRRLRDDPLTAHIPVVIFSILAAAGRAGEAGASAFLRKPIVESVFIATVHEVMAAERSFSMEQQS